MWGPVVSGSQAGAVLICIIQKAHPGQRLGCGPQLGRYGFVAGAAVGADLDGVTAHFAQ